MTYQKTQWAEDVGITVERLNNLETQYEKAVQHTDYRIEQINITSGSGNYASERDLEEHVNASAPHSDHVRGSVRLSVSPTPPTIDVKEGDIWIMIE